jgi:hypothetical protein
MGQAHNVLATERMYLEILVLHTLLLVLPVRSVLLA